MNKKYIELDFMLEILEKSRAFEICRHMLDEYNHNSVRCRNCVTFPCEPYYLQLLDDKSIEIDMENLKGKVK